MWLLGSKVCFTTVWPVLSQSPGRLYLWKYNKNATTRESAIGRINKLTELQVTLRKRNGHNVNFTCIKTLKKEENESEKYSKKYRITEQHSKFAKKQNT